MDLLFRGTALEPVAEKVAAGARLSRADGIALFRDPDLAAVGRLANQVRERLHGDVAYFVRNQHLNYTNFCDKTCLFCAFQRSMDAGPEYGGYVLSTDEIRARVLSGDPPPSEIHVVGGVNPRLSYDYYLEVVRTIREASPPVHIKAFTMVEIEEMARVSGRSHRRVLEDLKEAGLDAMPGGGAEVFSPRVHRKLFHDKIDGDGWIDIARTAHGLGIPSNASLLYGHIETVEERVDHLIRLRELQDETGGIQAFIPLTFHPDNTRMAKLPKPTAADDLRVIAASRLLLDNVPHIKAYWIMITPRTAQVALSFGADDVDGTVVEEQIYHDAGASTPQALSVRELVHLIDDAGRRPVERDALYRHLRTEFDDLRREPPAKPRRAVWLETDAPSATASEVTTCAPSTPTPTPAESAP